MKLREIAHARAGDKGDTLNIAVICFDERDFVWLERELSVERVRAAFAGILGDEMRGGEVRRYPLPGLGAINFVLEQVLGGGVTISLSTDPHGKSLSSVMLAIDMPEAEPIFGRRHPLNAPPAA